MAQIETTKTKTGGTRSFVQICVLQIESYIMKHPRGEGPLFKNN